jgi:hypothetical protein
MLVAKILLTLAVLGFSALPARADLNATHAANPSWTGHARFHVVWQVLSYIGLGILALVLLWASWSHETARAVIVALIATCVYGGFFGAVAFQSRYGGSLFDENGYPPVPVRVGARPRQIDLNVTAFSVMSLVLGLAWLLAAIS